MRLNSYTTFSTQTGYTAWDMDKFRLGIQCRTTNPNPYCEKELDEAIVSMKALLIQFKTR